MVKRLYSTDRGANFESIWIFRGGEKPGEVFFGIQSIQYTNIFHLIKEGVIWYSGRFGSTVKTWVENHKKL